MRNDVDPLDDHRTAITSYVTRAASVPEIRWTAPRAEGKWTPAQEIEHVALVYEMFARDLSGGEPMKPIGRPWQRFIWRFAVMRWILGSGRMPRAVSAPREVRPAGPPMSREELMARLQRASGEFERVFDTVWRENPQRQVSHPYFGRMALRDAARLVAVHTIHHTKFLSQS